MTNYPEPATEPDDGYNPTWKPETFPDTISGIIEARVTLRFTSPRDPERPTFEKLTIQTSEGELVDVLGGSARLARLITKFDPKVGDAVSITHFGEDSKGWPRFGMTVDKSARLEQDKLVEEARAEEAMLGEEDAA